MAAECDQRVARGATYLLLPMTRVWTVVVLPHPTRRLTVSCLLNPGLELVDAGVAASEGGLHRRLYSERGGGGDDFSLWPLGW